MEYELKATQCRRTRTLYLTGKVFTPVAGYVVDTLTLSLKVDGETANLEMDMFPPSGGGLRFITGSNRNAVPVALSFAAGAFVRTLTVQMNDQTFTLDVSQISDPDPTD